jgi:nitroreductase
MHTVLEAIGSRRSANRLTGPGPTGAELRQMLRAAAAAPDHGRCRPWRFIVVQKHNADDFGAVLEEAYVARCALAGEPVDEQRRARERDRVNRWPALVIVACEPNVDAKVPVHEQYAAVAAATQNLLLSATALGYGSKWATGAAATDPVVREALGLSRAGSVVGFVYLGSVPGGPGRQAPERPVDLSDRMRVWEPPATHPAEPDQFAF